MPLIERTKKKVRRKKVIPYDRKMEKTGRRTPVKEPSSFMNLLSAVSDKGTQEAYARLVQEAEAARVRGQQDDMQGVTEQLGGMALRRRK